ncbi:MAG: hypothetical protein AAF492_04325, partial [Verrucomicrobiota bacterium]
LAKLQEALKNAPDEVTKAAALDDLKKLKEETDAQILQFIKFAVHVDVTPFYEEPSKEFKWQDEVGKILKPVLSELENATAASRAIGDLRTQLESTQIRRSTAGEAVTNLTRLTQQTLSSALGTRLEEELGIWTRRFDEARNEQTALQLQLDNRLADRKSFLDSTTGYAQRFFKTRGVNLFSGIAAFFIVFFLVRLTGKTVERVRRKKGKDFAQRLGALLAQLLSVIGGLLAMLFIFNMAGDWFLLGIIIIFLLGVGWASIQTLPQHLETMKLLLNIGAVREDERIVFDGTPWQVESLNFTARLVNPLLDGGEQRLPIKYLVGLHSRPNGNDEEWFPSRKGDWVELSDGRIGRVAYQTPSTVQLTELGGAQIVFQTPDYLALSPRNLSTNFRIQAGFGIDYKHQAIATTEVPQKMQKKLEAELPAVTGDDQINSVNVALMAAAPSSIDYSIEVDLKGSCAERYLKITHAIPRILVEACTENGWDIPFTQLTIHQQ